MEIKLGIGVTSKEPYDIRRLVLSNFNPATRVSVNYDQISVAKDKNKLIKELYDGGATHLFLFDDDCFPIKRGWEKFFIDAANDTGVQHFVLANEGHNAKCGYMEDVCELWTTGTGCFMFLTRAVVEKVGFINPAYGKYGYEHAGYSLRICKAGFTPAWYVSVNGWEEYIYSWDLDKDGASRHGYTKIQNMTEAEKGACIAENAEVFNKEQDSGQIYYGFDA